MNELTSLRFRAHTVVTAATALLFVIAGCGADDPTDSTQADNQGETEEFGPEVIVEIDTVVDPDTAVAGKVVDVDCQYLNPMGNPIEPDGELTEDETVLTYPNNAFEADDGDLIAVVAGPTEFACQNPQLGLTDAEPELVDIAPGAPETTRLEMDRHQMIAGEQAHATCSAFDAYGNRIDDADFELSADSSSSAIVLDDDALTVEITSTGIYTLSCDAGDASYQFGDVLEVLPAKPAELYVAPTPNQQVYTTGQIIHVGALVEDRYGNAIPDAALDFDAGADSEMLGEGRFRFPVEGVYTVTTEVTEPTDDGEPLVEQFEVIINDTGPELNCVYPANGEMIDHSPGDTLQFEGIAADDFDIDHVVVNGETVSVDSKGAFQATIEADYGINFVELSATDEHGEQNVHNCSFLASDNYADEYTDLDEAVSLQLRQDAVDNGVSYSPWSHPETLNQLIETVLNSEGLRSEIESQLIDESPFDGGTCSAEVWVEGLDFVGDAHTTSLDLIDGGLEMAATINDIEMDLDIDLAWYCTGGGSTTAQLEWIDIDLIAEIDMMGNTPNVTLVDVEVESGPIDASGWLASIITSLFQGTFQGIVEDTFEDAITDNFDELFEDLLNSIDTYSTGFDVPRLDSLGTIPVEFVVGLAGLDFNSSYAQFDVAADIDVDHSATPQPPEAADSLGIPYPAPGGDFSTTMTGVDYAGGTAHVVLLNKALHELWRAGLFHADLSATFSSIDVDIPDDATVDLQAGLPPMAVLDDDGAEVMLGAVRLEIVYPGIFDEPVTFDIGASATTDINMSSDEIDFDDVTIDQFHFSTQDVSINQGTYDALEGFLMALMQGVIDDAVNSALPAIPIPSFTIPDSMGAYDLPAGDDLGLTSATIDQTETHLEITGELGIQ